MKVKIGTLFNVLAQKIGIDTTQKEFIDLLSANLEIPQTLNDSILSLVEGSVESALQNPNVRKRLTAEILTPIDKQLLGSLEKFGLSDEDIEEITSAKTTKEKMKIFDQKLETAHNVLKENADKKFDSKDKEALEATIKANYDKSLNEQVKKLKSEHEALIEKLNADFSGREENWNLEKGVLGKKLNFDEKIPYNIQINTVLNAYKNELAEKGLKLIKDENGKRVIVKADNTPVYNSKNEAFSPDTHLAEYLANNNLLDVRGSQQQQQQQQQIIADPNIEKPNTEAIAMLQDSIDQFN